MVSKVVSYSEVDTYRQCRLKHQLSYLERWNTDDTAPALSRGTLFHSVLEAHYRLLAHLREVDVEVTAEDLFLAVAPLLYEEGTGRQTDEQELVEWIYQGYVEDYRLDDGDPEPNWSWEIYAIEYPLDVVLPEEDGSDSDFTLAGTVDLIVRDKAAGGGLWIVDHKTCRNLPKGKDYDMEDQTGLYTYLLKRAGLDIRGAIYNHCRTWKLQRPMGLEERFKRHRTVRTDQELATMALEVLALMREAYDRPLGEVCEECGGGGADFVVFDTETGMKESPRCEVCHGTGVVYTKDAPRSPDGERCGWKCGFTEACLAGRKSGPERTRSFLRDIGFEQKDHKPGPTFQNRAKANQ